MIYSKVAWRRVLNRMSAAAVGGKGMERACPFLVDCARVARPSGKTSQILVRDAVAASEQPAVRAVATRLVMASSSFQAH